MLHENNKDRVIDLDDVFKRAHIKIYEQYGERVPVSVIKNIFNSQLIGTGIAMNELRTIKWNGLGRFRITEEKKNIFNKLVELKEKGLKGIDLKNALKEYITNKDGKNEKK